MSRIYDNWGRLIGATLKREQFRELARDVSRDPSFSSISSYFSSTISLSSPLHDKSAFDTEASSGPPSTLFYNRDSIIDATPRSAGGILELPSAKPISFKELKNATKNFHSDAIIGGGFGRVYKGWIDEHALIATNPGSGTPVAIKTWNSGGEQGFSEWLTGVNYLTQLRHPNLIRLIAYFHEGNNMLLVYEFMPRGSLENHLFGSHLTEKCDVYGFGIILLELPSRRRAIDRSTGKTHNLVDDWAKLYLPKKRKVDGVMDAKLEGKYNKEEARIVANLALQCISHQPESKLCIAEVLATLERL